MAAKYQIKIKQGSEFERFITWKDKNNIPIDVTNYTAKLHIRNKISNSSILLLELTTENGGITLGGADGKITLKINAATSSAFTWIEGVYDLELISPIGYTLRILEGRVNINAEVTI